jgi:FdhD protein
MDGTSPAMTAPVVEIRRPDLAETANAPSASRLARAYRYDAGASGPSLARAVAVETPIEIAYGGQAFAVMMGTPTDLEDFAAGFSLTEGIVERFEEIRAIEARIDNAAARVDVALTGDRLRVHLARRRAVAGRTGCGVCGIEDLEHLPKARRRGSRSEPPSPAAVGRAVEALDAHQPLNALTRAVHGAAWCDPSGEIHLAREDVGRHNALDKCIGALLRDGVDPEAGFLVVTSRCSYEMVTKAAAFGAGALVAVSAPTSLALDVAQAAGVALIVTARRDSALTYGASE